MPFAFGDSNSNVHHEGREEQVALWRADGHTYREIGTVNDVSGTRAVQLEAKFLRLWRAEKGGEFH